MKINKISGQKDIIKRVLQYLKKYRIWMLLSLLFAAVVVALSLYVPILIGKAIDQIVEPGVVAFKEIVPILIRVGIIVGITSVIQWGMNLINNKITFQVVRDIRNSAFEKIERLPLKYIDDHSYGEIVSRVISDVEQFADGLLMGFTQLFTGLITIVGTLAFMLTIHVGITVVVVVLTPLSLLVANFIAKRTYSMFRVQSSTRGEQTALIDEMIGNQKVVMAYNYQDNAIQRFEEINNRLQSCSLKAIFYSSLTNPVTRFINGIVYAAVCLAGAIAVLKGFMTIGGLSCFLNYANQYTKPFNEISGVITELQNALACATRIFDLIEEEPQVSDIAQAIEMKNPSGNVKLEHVSFSYVPERELIKDFNLAVEPGQRVAIVGPTGCGKSTIINLLMRFSDVDSGKIKVEDIPIREITRKSLRSGYGMVLQETWLKAGTIRENIAMGRPEASMEEIVEAAKATHAHNFIKRLPDGYETIINEDGDGLSQGQRQLLCIARIMLTLPPMLILDEATSSIDTRTEIKIQKAFQTLMKGRTSFIVAHRLSTIKEADIILVMRDGTIVEHPCLCKFK